MKYIAGRKIKTIKSNAERSFFRISPKISKKGTVNKTTMAEHSEKIKEIFAPSTCLSVTFINSS